MVSLGNTKTDTTTELTMDKPAADIAKDEQSYCE